MHSDPEPRPFPPSPRTLGDSIAQDAMLRWLASARDWTPGTAPSWMERLRADGVNLPSPDEATDEAMPHLCHRLIVSLAERGVYLDHTDHLDHRELYTYLVGTALAIPSPPRAPDSVELIDLCPPYGQGIDLMLACYATDEVRAELSASGVDVPPRRPKRANRDATLPRPAELS